MEESSKRGKVIPNGVRVRCTSVDMYGFNGRDLHPSKDDVGFVGVVEKSSVEQMEDDGVTLLDRVEDAAPETDVGEYDCVCYTVRGDDGRVLELMDHEVEQIDALHEASMALLETMSLDGLCKVCEAMGVAFPKRRWERRKILDAICDASWDSAHGRSKDFDNRLAGYLVAVVGLVSMNGMDAQRISQVLKFKALIDGIDASMRLAREQNQTVDMLYVERSVANLTMFTVNGVCVRDGIVVSPDDATEQATTLDLLKREAERCALTYLYRKVG